MNREEFGERSREADVRKRGLQTKFLLADGLLHALNGAARSQASRADGGFGLRPIRQ